MKKVLGAIIIAGVLLGACSAGAYTTITSDDEDNFCYIYNKQEYKSWAKKTSSHALSNIWPTQGDYRWKYALKKARNAMICFGDAFCAFGGCIRTMTGSYFDKKGNVAARTSGAKLWDSSETCWSVTINGSTANVHCQ